jgi:acetyltransferase-like isoleucine patch superfamily enzyme
MKIPFLSFGIGFIKNRLSLDKINYYFSKRKFRKLDSVVSRKAEFKNPHRISIAERVVIKQYSWIAAMINDLPLKNVFDPWIDIQEGVSIGRFAHITVSNGLVIEKNVLITEGVLISDTIHGYEDVNQPIIKQRMFNKGPIRIKEGAWIGNGARLVGSLTVGRNSIVGANCYLDRDVPDYCLVGGIPAVILKKYDFEKKTWINCRERLSKNR